MQTLVRVVDDLGKSIRNTQDLAFQFLLTLNVLQQKGLITDAEIQQAFEDASTEDSEGLDLQSEGTGNDAGDRRDEQS